MFLEKIMIEYKVQYILNTIGPVFVMIGLGAALRLGKFIKDDIAAALIRLTYWVALPALLFYNISTSQHGYKQAMGIAYVILGTMAAAIMLAWLFCLVFRVDRKNTGAFVQGAYRGNLMFIGLPMIIYSIASGTSSGKTIEQTAVLALSVVIPAYNAAGIMILLTSRHNIDINMPVKIVKGLLTNPLVISSICGMLYAHFFSSLPLLMERSLQITSRMALPLSLLGIGATLVGTRNAADYSLSIAASLIKVLFCPVFAFFMARWLRLNSQQTSTALLFAACPTAISSYVMASQMGSNGRLAAAIVIVSSLLSIAGFIAILLLI